MTYAEAVMLADLIRELELKRDRQNDYIDGLKDKLKAFLAEQGESSMVLGNHKVSYIEYEACRFDTKAFKEDYKDLYAQYEKSSTVKRFTIN